MVVKLTVEDKALLVQIPDLLATVGHLPIDSAVPVLNRAAYPDDDEASAEFQELVGSQLATDRAADLEILMELTGTTSTITADDAKSVLRAINAARLILAARSNVFDEGSGWESRISQDPALAAVAWLGSLQSDLIEALSE
ncbi:MAG: DUF2017 family protein [Acidimicrobiia bacterium]|nr:DUF2017 family protein [Acidimicrobiia bacterium]